MPAPTIPSRVATIDSNAAVDVLETQADDRLRDAASAVDIREPVQAVDDSPARDDSRRPATVVAVFSFVLYTVFSLRRHQLFQTGGYDLGIFGQGISAYAHLHLPDSQIRAPVTSSGGGFPLLGDHFSPVLALLGPVYRLVPHVEILLIAQAALVAASVYIVTNTATRRLGSVRHGRWAGPATGFAYALSWGIQRLVGFDFHEVCFALPLLCLAMEAYLARRWGRCAVWACTLLLVKEDMGFTVFAFGLLLLAGGRSRRLGALLCLIGPTAAALIVFVVIPHSNPGHVYGYLGGEAADGTGVHGFLSHPWQLPILLVWPTDKLVTLILVLLPTGFLALRSPLILIAVPDLVLRFVADNTFYWGTKYQYSAALMPVVFYALIDVLQRWPTSAKSAVGHGPRAIKLPTASALTAIALAPFFGLGELATPDFWHDSPRIQAANHAINLIPNGARVAAADEIAPHLIDRDTVSLDWNGLFNPGAPRFDWIIADVTPQAPWRDDPRIVHEALADGYVETWDAGGYVVLHLRSDRPPVPPG